MKYITIGEIINVRGIRGEIKVKPLTSDILRFNKLKLVYIDEKPYKILRLYIERDFVFMGLMDVVTRNDAEALKGKFLTIDEVNAVSLDENEHFIAEILGMQAAFEDGTVLGVIENIDQFGSADVFTVLINGGKRVRFPFLNRIVQNVDYDKRVFVLIKQRFDEVAVYED